MSWVAEDVPWWSVDESVSRPWRDEDVAMSTPCRIGEYATHGEAVQALADEMNRISGFTHLRHEWQMWRSAAHAVAMGVDGIRIHGRYYRVRSV